MAVIHFPPGSFPTEWVRALQRLASEHGGTCEVERRFMLFVRSVTVTIPDSARAAFERDFSALQEEIAAMQAIR